MERVLVTGGAGFVGSHLAIGIRQHKPNLSVVVLDNLKRRGSELNILRLREADVEFIHGDIRNPEDLEAVGSIDWLLECSAEPSVLAGYDGSPQYMLNTNLTGTINCLEVARRFGTGIIFLSTSRVYPTGAINSLAYEEETSRFALKDKQLVPGASRLGISECFPLDGTRSLYGATKLCSELVMQEYLEMYSLHGVINRCGLLTGPWQMGKVDQGVVVFWLARHIYGGDLNYIGFGGKGKQVRDMLHVDDLLRLILYEMGHVDEINGRVFNVGGGLAVSASLQELTDICQELTGNTIAIGGISDNRPGDILFYVTDHSLLTAETGWRPRKDVVAIMEEIHTWIWDNRERLRDILA